MGGAACKAKVILNSGMIQAGSYELCSLVKDVPDDDFPYREGIEIVKMLNEAEDLILKAQRVFLDWKGFEGPWPNSLKVKADEKEGE